MYYVELFVRGLKIGTFFHSLPSFVRIPHSYPFVIPTNTQESAIFNRPLIED